MKPIKLKIRGLNSFIEEQTIDFEKLTDRGFFGIFGPTGSGKSTVLDGITLALYGEVARKSSNYINTNCDSASVSFEFQISGAINKRYSVEREFKSDKKTGNPRSGKCKVIDISSEDTVVLADGANEVKAVCREIIGLNLDDFTRTVVLPQGKFSEFLKLEGKERRVMLERLFNLSQYGDNLDRKLAREINKEKTENSVLIGQLKGYEDISEEREKAKEEEVKESNNILKEATKEFKNLEKEYLESKEVWNLQSELNEHKKSKEILKEKESEIEENKKKVKLGEAAARVLPHVTSYENTENEILKSKDEENKLKETLEEIEIEKTNIEKVWIVDRDRKHKELPSLIVKEENIKNALEEQKVVTVIEGEIKELKIQIIKIKDETYEKEENLKTINVENVKVASKVKECEEKIETLKIDNDFKEKMQQGDRLFEKYNELSKIIKDNKNKKDKLESELLKYKTIEKELTKQLNEKLGVYKENNEVLKNLINNVPGNQDDLTKLQNELFASKENWANFNRYNKEKEEAVKSITLYKNELKDYVGKRNDLEDVVKNIKTNLKELEVENLAYKLREELIKGEVCPVCGSEEHHIEKIKHVDLKDSKEIEKNLEDKEKEFKIIESKIISLNTNISLLEERAKQCEGEIIALGEEFKKNSVMELEEKVTLLDKALKNYNIQKEKLEEIISKIKDEGSKLREEEKGIKANVESIEKQLVDVKEDINKNSKNLEEVTLEFNNLKNETKVDDFKKKYNQIVKIEKEREQLLSKVKTYRDKLDILNNKAKELEKNINEGKENLTKIKTSINEKEKNKEEKTLLIIKKVGEVENLDNLLMEIQKSIYEIENNFKTSEKNKEEIDIKFQSHNEMLIKVVSKLSDLNLRRNTDKEKLEFTLKEEGFESIDSVKDNIVNKDIINDLKEKIDKFNNDLSKTIGAIESVVKKINNRYIEEEAWVKLQENKLQKEEELVELNKRNINVKEELKSLKEKLSELKELLKKRDKLAHKLGVLEDLQKLFKGKKFVEFVATTRLKYVSIEASKILSEITNGNYGLEADENGKFIIRDYKNGGVARDASTLSGGETFLASLALALALSSQIQLKGTAQLELFFLDEGFGTLDDNLLEVVMSSLEKIHNDKLKVGIISHVESIKNRVPVKLILTPAESGRGGSKVKIERT